jgi:hypothetical protein
MIDQYVIIVVIGTLGFDTYWRGFTIKVLTILRVYTI